MAPVCVVCLQLGWALLVAKVLVGPPMGSMLEGRDVRVSRLRPCHPHRSLMCGSGLAFSWWRLNWSLAPSCRVASGNLVLTRSLSLFLTPDSTYSRNLWGAR